MEGKTVGKDNQKNAVRVVDSLMSKTRLVGLLIVHGCARCPSRGWYAEEPHDKGEKAVGFMVSTTTGKVGGDKRGKDNA